MKNQKKLCAALVSSLLCLAPAIAQAHVTRVWYDTKNEPAGFSRTLLLRTIQSTLREWEYHGRGQLAMKWEGVTFDKPGGGGDDLIFGWDPSLVGSSTCAQTWTYTAFQVAPMGRVDMNPAVMGSSAVYSGTPILGNGCLVGKAVLQHEMAHWFRWDTGHFNDSVLGSTCAQGGICTDFMALNLWNGDMDGINQNIYFPIFAPTYPPLGVSVSTDVYSNGNGAVTGGTSTSLSSGGPQNFTGSLGVGGPSSSYSRAFTDGASIAVEQGNGLNSWGNRRTINDFTRRQMCVTGVTTSSDMYAVWTSNAQVATALVANVGARNLRYSESHDGGNTWSAPTNIGSLQTRTGVSCGFDIARNRVVVAWANPTTFQVNYTERAPGDVGAAAWAGARAISGPLTFEIPMIQFDPFTSNSGFLTWHGVTSGGFAFISKVYHNGTSYALSYPSGVSTMDLGEDFDLRTEVIPNPFGTEMHYAYGRNSGPPSSQIRTRRGNTYAILSSDTSTEASGFEPTIDRYVGSANDRAFYSSAYLRHTIVPH